IIFNKELNFQHFLKMPRRSRSRSPKPVTFNTSFTSPTFQQKIEYDNKKRTRKHDSSSRSRSRSRSSSGSLSPKKKKSKKSNKKIDHKNHHHRHHLPLS